MHMSRGPGIIQKSIIGHVRENGEGTLTVETMRWALYDKLKEKALAPDGSLPTAWNTAFSRAVERLAAPPRSQLVVNRRPLASLEECVQHYPGKTLLVATRRLRLELLPSLKDFVEQNHQPPRYSAASNEEYHIEQLPRQDRKAFEQEWKRLVAELKQAFAVSDDDTLLSLIVKGKSLFEEKSTLSERRSFLELSSACCRSGMLSEGLSDRLRRFTERFLPANTAGSLRLKSYIHLFALPSRNGRYSLKERTIQELRRRNKAFVESLPGFKPVDSQRRYRKPQHSPMLHKLFDQTVFQDFRFIHLAE